MIIAHHKLKEAAPSILVTGDIHINASLDYTFEAERLSYLAEKLRKRNPSAIVLAGDTFDKDTPSLKDIQLFYKFITELSTEVLVIEGNHDSSVFNYLPEAGFHYCKQPTIVNDEYLLVGHTQLESLQKHLESHQYPSLSLISHARCNIPPHIVEETSIEALSKSFKRVILGDIHTAPVLPYDNVHYVTSPSNVTFTPYRHHQHGFLSVSSQAGVTFISTAGIPSKSLKVCKTLKEVRDTFALESTRDYQKVRFAGTTLEVTEANRLTRERTVKDFHTVAFLAMSHEGGEEAARLADFLGSKVSLVEYAFNYFSKAKHNPEAIKDIKAKYLDYRASVGRH